MDVKLLLSFLATGIPGLISYWFLSQISIIKHNSEKDKTLFITALSLINILISYLSLELLTWISKIKLLSFIKINYSNPSRADIILIFGLSLFVTWILSRYVYNNIFKYMNKYINSLQIKFDVPLISNFRTLETIILEKKNKNGSIFIYIFDFDNKFIESGYLNRFNEEYKEISLHDHTNYIHEKFTIHEVLTYFNDNDDAEIFIDLENKLKYYIFFY